MWLKRLIACGALVLPLSACVFQNMDKGLAGLEGKNIDQAVAELGYPDSQGSIMGNTVYVWGTSNSFSMPVTTYNTTTGYVGTVPYSATTSNTNYVPENFNCVIRIATSPDGTIIHTEWQGNVGGCMHYSTALKQNENSN
jgi:hypothetical protein